MKCTLFESLTVWPALAVFERSWRQIFVHKYPKVIGNFLGSLKTSLSKKNKLAGLLLGPLLEQFGYFHSNIWSHYSLIGSSSSRRRRSEEWNSFIIKDWESCDQCDRMAFLVSIIVRFQTWNIAQIYLLTICQNRYQFQPSKPSNTAKNLKYFAKVAKFRQLW